MQNSAHALCCPVPLSVLFPHTFGSWKKSFFRLLQLNPAAEETRTAQTKNKITNEKLL